VDSSDVGWDPEAGCYVHCSEPSGIIKGRAFLQQLVASQERLVSLYLCIRERSYLAPDLSGHELLLFVIPVCHRLRVSLQHYVYRGRAYPFVMMNRFFFLECSGQTYSRKREFLFRWIGHNLFTVGSGSLSSVNSACRPSGTFVTNGAPFQETAIYTGSSSESWSWRQ
jgi:hypothetical protein